MKRKRCEGCCCEVCLNAANANIAQSLGDSAVLNADVLGYPNVSKLRIYHTSCLIHCLLRML